MKICAIICEYNPFHNGHLYQIRLARSLFPDHALLCVMSGNFIQRGEPAVMDKFTRAKHAVQNGADAVIELPTVFATSNAELFAQGAIHLLASLPDVKTLCFGAETADKSLFLRAAALCNDEPREVSKKIKLLTANGVSYARAYQEAYADYIDPDFLRAPNNILGIEYTKALLKKGSPIEIAPIERVGNGYADKTLRENFSSASAIREAITNGASIEGNVPDCVRQDLPKCTKNALDALEKYAVLSKKAEKIRNVCDCTEGLENALKKAALLSAPLYESLTSARYTASRIRRIALQNLLGIEERHIRECLSAPLYLRLLCAKKESRALLASLGGGRFPLLVRAQEGERLDGIAKTCFLCDRFSEQVYSLLYPVSTEKQLFL